MPNEYLSDPTALIEHIQHLEKRIEQNENDLDELIEEFGDRIRDRREFNRQRRLLESILVEVFSLPSSEVLYRRDRKYPTGSAYNRLRDINLAVNPEKPARIILYYILWRHCAGASRRLLEPIYGWSCRRTIDQFVFLETHQHLIRLKRKQAERMFLDAIGRSDEPVSEVSDFQFAKAKRYVSLSLLA